MYTDEYIRELQNRTGNDPALLERVVYAFRRADGDDFPAKNLRRPAKNLRRLLVNFEQKV